MREKRTDLAVEARELAGKEAEKLPGVTSEEKEAGGYGVTVVRVEDRAGEKALGKPKGCYVTIDLTRYWQREEDYFDRAVSLLGEELAALLPEGDGPVLVAGLGNPAMTPDALGPKAAGHVLATRHLLAAGEKSLASLSPLAVTATEVVGNTGIEAAEQVKALTKALSPRAVVLIDALAARRLDRLCRTVQLSDTGLVPGSGVGNHRMALDRETLGVPVLSLGVPTVVEGATLAADLLEEAGMTEELPALRQGLFVTPREIDAEVAEMARVIGYGINAAVQGFSAADSAALLG